MTNRRKVGMTSSHHGPYDQGYTRTTMGGTEGRKAARWSQSQKTSLSPDRSLQLDCVKSESLVIANQPCVVSRDGVRSVASSLTIEMGKTPRIKLIQLENRKRVAFARDTSDQGPRPIGVIWSSEQACVVDALAVGGDEGRSSLRKVPGSWQTSFDPGMSEWGNPRLRPYCMLNP